MRLGTGIRRFAILAALLLFVGGCERGRTTPGPRASAAAPGSTSAGVRGGGATPPSGEGSGSLLSRSREVFAPQDDVLSVAVKEPTTLDPMRVADRASVLIARQLYEGLTRWDANAGQVVPAAAESWSVGNGGRRFIFKLRAGMTFHNGAPVTAGNFVYALDRIAKKAAASDLAYLIARVQGFEEVNRVGTSDHLSGLQTDGKLKLIVTLNEPFRDFPAVLTHPGLVPLPRKVVQNENRFVSSPVGNGSFQMARPWAPGQPIYLKSFPGAVDQPELDGIRFLPYADSASSWLRFLDGNLDVAEVPAGQVESARKVFGDRGYQPFLSGEYYGLNLSSEEVDNIALRRAVMRAIDRNSIAQTIYKGTLAPPRGIVPTGMPGFEKDACGELCEYSPEAARGFLLKVPDKQQRITLAYNRESPQGQVASAIKQNLEAVGITVKLRGYRFPKFLKLLEDGNAAMYRLGWLAEYPSPEPFLSALFKSDSPDNHSGFASGAVDGLLRKAETHSSPEKRTHLYRLAEKAILKQIPIVPLGSFVSHWAAQTDVKGIVFDQLGGFDAASITLSEPSD